MACHYIVNSRIYDARKGTLVLRKNRLNKG